MKKKRRYWIRLSLLLLMIGLIGFAFYQQFHEGESQKPKVGDLAPNFQLSTLDGQPTSLQQLKGKAVILNFWASWCEPCRTEMPALTEIYRLYEKEGLMVIGVNIAENDVSVMQFVKQYRLQFPIWMDRNREVVELYKIGPLPSTYFIDPDGKIAYIHEGPLQLNELRNIVLQLLPRSEGAIKQ